MGDRIERIQSLLSEIHRETSAMETLRAGNVRMMGELAEQNRQIAGSLCAFRFAADVYSRLVRSDLDALPEVAFGALIAPLSDLVQHGSAYLALSERSTTFGVHVQDVSVVTGTTSVASSVSLGDTVAAVVGSAYADRSRRVWLRERIAVHLAESRIDAQIPCLRSQLSRYFPELLDDFEHNMAGYQAGPPGTKYQELISFRSVFFLKLVQASARKEGYRGDDKGKMARVFICGSTPTQYPDEVNRIAKAYQDLWTLLSSQNEVELGAKMGIVTEAYVELMFRACVEIAAEVLRLRETQRGSTPAP